MLKMRDEESQVIINRSKDDALKSSQRASQLETEMAYLRRQHDDEFDRLDRELRRYHADMSEIVLENRRLKAQVSSNSYARPLREPMGFEEYGMPPPPQPRQHNREYAGDRFDARSQPPDSYDASNQHERR